MDELFQLFQKLLIVIIAPIYGILLSINSIFFWKRIDLTFLEDTIRKYLAFWLKILFLNNKIFEFYEGRNK